MIERNVENFIGCDSDYTSAEIVLYGAPYDSTTSFRPGQDSDPPPCGMKASDWRHTVLIRIGI